MLDHRFLPLEMWFEILEWATYNPNLLREDSTPFQPIPDTHTNRDPNLPARVAISRVCRVWRTWVAQILLKDLEIRHGTHALQQLLERREASGPCNGELVRRVVLPYHSTVPGPSWSPQTISILELCPQVHTLFRPHYSPHDGLRFDREVGAAAFPSLRRLEWWYHGEAERSGGINSLSTVLRSAPHLRWLFIGSIWNYMYVDPSPIDLPNLKTLRLNVSSGLLLRQILTRWFLPGLTHMIIDSPPVKEGSYAIWEAFGDRLERVELGKHMRFLMTRDLSSCLKCCPNLKELNYHIFFTQPIEGTPAHSQLATVGLHAAENASFAGKETTLWNLIDLHFQALCADNLSGLRNIVLYGDWGPYLSRPRLHFIQKRLEDRGINLQHEDENKNLKNLLK